MIVRNKNKHVLRIPKDVSLIFCQKQKILTAIGPLKNKSLKLKLKVIVNSSLEKIIVSPIPLFKASNAEKKKIKMLQKTTVVQLRHLFIESSVKIHQKLKIIGVGFKADFATTSTKEKILTFKLGFSHLTFVKIPNDLSIKRLTKTIFCIWGNSYSEITNFSSLLRSQKKPEPYKGKGILFDNEEVKIKEGKKI